MQNDSPDMIDAVLGLDVSACDWPKNIGAGHYLKKSDTIVQLAKTVNEALVYLFLR